MVWRDADLGLCRIRGMRRVVGEGMGMGMRVWRIGRRRRGGGRGVW